MAKKDQKTVQSGRIPSDCTDSAIVETVQLPIDGPLFVNAETFRAKMRAYLDGAQPFVIGTDWHARAIVLPLSRERRWSSHDKAAEDRALKAHLEFLLGEV